MIPQRLMSSRILKESFGSEDRSRTPKTQTQNPSPCPRSLRSLLPSVSQAFLKLLERRRRSSRGFRQGLAMQKHVGHSVVVAPRTWHSIKRKGARRPGRSFGVRSATRDRKAARPSRNTAEDDSHDDDYRMIAARNTSSPYRSRELRSARREGNAQEA